MRPLPYGLNADVSNSLRSDVYAEFGKMPGIVQVKVAAARDLPVMDRSSELTDAFVEVN